MTNTEALNRKLNSLPEERRERLDALRDEIRKGDEDIERGNTVRIDFCGRGI